MITALFRNLPIRLKFVVPVIAAMVVMLISLNLYFPIKHKETLIHTYSQEARRTADLLSVAVSHALDQHRFELLQSTLEGAKIDPTILFIQIFDENGELLGVYNPSGLNLARFQADSGSAHVSQDEAVLVRKNILSQEEAFLGQILLAISLEDLNRQIRDYRIAIIIFSMIALFLGFVFIHQISERITRSLSQLHNQMKRIIETGSYTSEINVTSSDEVGRLAKDFKRMMDEVQLRHQHLLESQQEYRQLNQQLQKLNRLKTIFVSDASHALRTPLTIIKGEIDVTLRKKREPQEYHQVLEIIEDETAHLIRIVEHLLTLARADSGNLLFEEQAVNLSEICLMQIKEPKKLAEKKKIRFAHTIEPDCYVKGDPNRLGEVIFYLTENAVKYTPGGKYISITLEKIEQQIILQVTDTGIGIPEEEIDLIFSRFYRANNSRKKSKGTGLGLSICESVVQAHQGEIHVSSKLGKGSTFEVRLNALEIIPDAPQISAGSSTVDD